MAIRTVSDDEGKILNIRPHSALRSGGLSLFLGLGLFGTIYRQGIGVSRYDTSLVCLARFRRILIHVKTLDSVTPFPLVGPLPLFNSCISQKNTLLSSPFGTLFGTKENPYGTKSGYLAPF